MADYYPLLARALDALPDRSPAMRKAVYDRARGALIGQLRSLEPPLSQDDIDLESKALDAAIDRLEVDYGGAPAPANDPAPAAEAPAPAPASAAAATSGPATPFMPAAPQPEPTEPASAKPEPDDGLFEAEPAARREPSPPVFVEAEPARPEPSLPPAPPPDLGATPALPEPEPVRETPPLAIAPRKAKPPAAEEPVLASPAETEREPDTEAEPGTPRADAAGGRQRPRIDVVTPRGGRSKMLRNAFVGAVLAVVIGLIAVAAFLLRDKPADLQQTEAETGAPAETSDQKFADRVGGEPAPTQPPPGQPGASTQAEAPAQAPPPSQADLAVAQRATLIEENTAGQNAQPTSTTGRVVWRLESVNGEQGQPLETAVVATVEFPEAGLTLVATLQRNLDATLPASHTIKLAFTPSGPEGERRAVQDIGLLQAKDEEAARGSPLSGLPVRVRENLFLIGLSSLRNDIERNTDLLLHRNWFDLAVKYASGQRAVITFEKGTSGAYALQRAFEQWR